MIWCDDNDNNNNDNNNHNNNNHNNHNNHQNVEAIMKRHVLINMVSSSSSSSSSISHFYYYPNRPTGIILLLTSRLTGILILKFEFEFEFEFEFDFDLHSFFPALLSFLHLAPCQMSTAIGLVSSIFIYYCIITT